MRRSSLYIVLSCLGSQWSVLRIGVLCSWRDILATSLAAVFCTLWSLLISCNGKPNRMELQESRRDVTRACTSLVQVTEFKNGRICPIRRRAARALWHTLEMWSLMCRLWSTLTPRFLADEEATISESPIVISGGRRREPRGKVDKFYFSVVKNKFIFYCPAFNILDAFLNTTQNFISIFRIKSKEQLGVVSVNNCANSLASADILKWDTVECEQQRSSNRALGNSPLENGSIRGRIADDDRLRTIL